MEKQRCVVRGQVWNGRVVILEKVEKKLVEAGLQVGVGQARTSDGDGRKINLQFENWNTIYFYGGQCDQIG